MMRDKEKIFPPLIIHRLPSVTDSVIIENVHLQNGILFNKCWIRKQFIEMVAGVILCKLLRRRSRKKLGAGEKN